MFRTERAVSHVFHGRESSKSNRATKPLELVTQRPFFYVLSTGSSYLDTKNFPPRITFRNLFYSDLKNVVSVSFDCEMSSILPSERHFLLIVTLSHSRSHYKFSLLSAIEFSWCLFGEFGIGSTENPLVDIFLYSHHLSSWFLGFVRRNSVLVTHESQMVKKT